MKQKENGKEEEDEKEQNENLKKGNEEVNLAQLEGVEDEGRRRRRKII